MTGGLEQTPGKAGGGHWPPGAVMGVIAGMVTGLALAEPRTSRRPAALLLCCLDFEELVMEPQRQASVFSAGWLRKPVSARIPSCSPRSSRATPACPRSAPPRQSARAAPCATLPVLRAGDQAGRHLGR